ncbi:MAG: N-methyl-L-tryptophan oxidase [Verrucomicrobiota bacterium]|nr:N-methyl-L-tryptophan oxidase [Verrucomicrobiota bacterium]
MRESFDPSAASVLGKRAQLTRVMMYDLCVVGLGGMGSATLAQSAARGVRVIGLEQFSRGHALGASSGRTRMIRKAYFEDPAYVPLILRAYELWYALERVAGEQLLYSTGVLTVGTEASEIIAGTRRAAHEHNLALDCLTAADLRKRYPTLKAQTDEVGLFEPDAGVLKPERAIAAQLARAEELGATTRFNVAMSRWEARAGGYDVVLEDGSRVSARTLILALGPWVQRTLGDLGVAIRVQRNVQAWFAPKSDAYAAGSFPAFLLNRAGLPAPLYGFPDFGDGVKVAWHGFGDLTDAEQLNREIDQGRDIQPLARAMDAWMPLAASKFVDAKACVYSLTPDEHFVVDRHPEHERVILCGGFSGHGFKFAPVIGEVAADLAIDGATRHDIDFLSLRRFASTQDR